MRTAQQASALPALLTLLVCCSSLESVAAARCGHEHSKHASEQRNQTLHRPEHHYDSRKAEGEGEGMAGPGGAASDDDGGGGGGGAGAAASGPPGCRKGVGGPLELWSAQAPVLRTANIKAIFWGPSWHHREDDVIPGVDAFLKHYRNSNHAKLTNEYFDRRHSVSAWTAYHGHVIDARPTASPSPSYAEIMQVVCHNTRDRDDRGSGLYVVLYGRRRPAGQQFCGWHGSGVCRGVPLQWAFVYNLDGDAPPRRTPACDPGDTLTGNSQALAATVNIISHELAEARSNPDGDAWMDPCYSESADKCSWVFPVPYVKFADGRKWKLQALWSNRAFAHNAGEPNGAGQRGCVWHTKQV